MGSYPKQFPLAAVAVAEELVRDVMASRLEKVGWSWQSTPHHYVISTYEFAAVKAHMTRSQDGSVVQLLGIVFSHLLPELHHEFVSDGFRLGLGGTKDKPYIFVEQQPRWGSEYVGDWGPESAQACAYSAVRALIDWRLARHRESVSPGRWPNGPKGFDPPLIEGDIYPMIRRLARINWPRVIDIMEFVEKSVPDLCDAWTAAGYELTPFYCVDRLGRTIELRLIHESDRSA